MDKKLKGIVCKYCSRDIGFTADGRWIYKNGNIIAYSFTSTPEAWLTLNICPDCGLKMILSHPADLTDEERRGL